MEVKGKRNTDNQKAPFAHVKKQKGGISSVTIVATDQFQDFFDALCGKHTFVYEFKNDPIK